MENLNVAQNARYSPTGRATTRPSTPTFVLSTPTGYVYSLQKGNATGQGFQASTFFLGRIKVIKTDRQQRKKKVKQHNENLNRLSDVFENNSLGKFLKGIV
jgi:hypothetical protein